MSEPKKRHDVRAMLEELAAMPWGPERLESAQRGIGVAALAQDEDAGFSFREDLLTSCNLGGRLALAIPAMEWCLARCDAEPARFDVRRVLFQYKWIVEELPRHSCYEAATIEAGLDDVERRFAAVGWNKRGPLELRMIVAWAMRRLEEAERIFPEWDAMPRDEGSDCDACATAHKVRYLVNARKMKEAIEAAGPLVSGEQKCGEEPARCFSRLQWAYVEEGRFDEGVELHKRSMEEVAVGPQFADARANHMMFLMMTGNFELAGRVLEFALPQALESGSDLALLQTCDIGWVVLEVLRRRRLDMPTLEPAPELGVKDSAEWQEWMETQAVRLAPLFDARNGNGAYQEDRARWKEMAEQLGSAEI